MQLSGHLLSTALLLLIFLVSISYPFLASPNKTVTFSRAGMESYTFDFDIPQEQIYKYIKG